MSSALVPAAYFRSIPFLLELRFTISQAGVAARTLTLMQGSGAKKIEERSANRTRVREFSDTHFNHFTTDATLSICQRVVLSSS